MPYAQICSLEYCLEELKHGNNVKIQQWGGNYMNYEHLLNNIVINYMEQS